MTARTVVTGLAADGPRVAFAVGSRSGDCRHVEVWTRTTGKVRRLNRPRPCFLVGSTGSGLLGPTLAGTRALWITYVGGNIREWSLWTATTRPTAPRLLSFIARDVEDAGPFVLGEGDTGKQGDVLPYAVDSTLVALRSTGTIAFRWRAPSRIVAVASKGGEVAAAWGRVVTVIRGGEVALQTTLPAPAERVFITGNAVVAQHGVTIERRGTTARTWTVPRGARLVDAEGSVAVFVLGRAIHALRLDDGRRALVRRTARPPLTQLEPGGLVYASGRTIAVVRMSELLRRLGRAS